MIHQITFLCSWYWGIFKNFWTIFGNHLNAILETLRNEKELEMEREKELNVAAHNNQFLEALAKPARA